MKERLEELLGVRVVSLEFVQGGGYTHTGRHRAVLDDGRSVFVKSAVDELSAGWLREEWLVYEHVRAEFLAQCLAWDDGDLPLLVLEDLSDAHWPPPWRDGDLDAVLHSLAEIAAAPIPPGIQDIPREELAFEWRVVEADPAPFLSSGIVAAAWLDAHLPALSDASERAPLMGADFLHLDVRSDNIALRDGRAILIDWNWACRGNALLDLVAFCPSLHLEGGPRPDELVAGEGVGELAAALAGLWAARVGLPPPETGPRVREAQRRQLAVCLPWACRSLGIPEPG